jgi:type II secretory pathway pseudopilin PulG
MQKRGKSKRSQAWVETVIYTLIGLTIIGIVTGIATPRIKQITDGAIIEQTISVLNEIDQKINVVQTATGQSRELNLRVKKGKFIIDAEGDTITYVMEGTGLEYSKPGAEIQQGTITILTEEAKDDYDINLILKYDIDLKYDDLDQVMEFTQAPTDYRVLVENKGAGGIDFSLI